MSQNASVFKTIRRTWHQDMITLELPKRLHSCSIPDASDMVAFMDGPVVLAGLCSEEYRLVGNKDEPSSMLVPTNERKWGSWLRDFRTKDQFRGIKFIPLFDVVDEIYTVYFPISAFDQKN